MSGISEKLHSLHLSVNPFADTTPLAGFFPGGRRRQTLEQVVDLVASSGDVIAVVGAPGSGKSTLADFICRQASQQYAVGRVRASLLAGPVELLQEMYKAFVLDFPANSSQTQLQDGLDDYLDELTEQGRKAVLVIDDAHELGDEALSLLVRISLTDNPGDTFRLILLGDRALVDMLDYSCPLREGGRSYQVLELPAFSTEETSHYLRFRLNNAGFKQQHGVPPLPFDRRDIQRIHRQGRGLPGALNAAASQMLDRVDSPMARLEKLLPGGLGRKLQRLPWHLPGKWLDRLQDKLPGNLSARYVAAGAAVVIVALLVLVLGGGEPQQVATADRTVTLPLSGSSQADEVVAVESPAGRSSPVGEAAPVEETVAGSTQNPTRAADQPAASSPAAASATPESNRPAAGGATSVASRPTSTTAAASGFAASGTSSGSRTAATGTSSAARSSAGTDVLAQQKALIQALPSDGYTLQLLGAWSRSNVEELVARHSDSELYWYETTLQNRSWYVLIHGAYPVPSAARAAIAELPAALREQQPWVRNIDDVQRESAASQ